MNELTETLREEFKDKETRHVYCDEFLNSSIATQIKVLREQREMTQKELAELAGMRQERISVLEDVNYSSWTINVLRRLAEAFDLTLTVKFESFGEKLFAIEDMSRETLEKPSFDEDPVFQDIPQTVTTTTLPGLTYQQGNVFNAIEMEAGGIPKTSLTEIVKDFYRISHTRLDWKQFASTEDTDTTVEILDEDFSLGTFDRVPASIFTQGQSTELAM